MMQLSEHFTLEELTFSETATRFGIDNTPSPEHMNNLRTVLVPILEEARRLLRHPIIISSGYRSPAVNKAIGGSLTSAHMMGLAADFRSPGFGSPLEVARYLSSQLQTFDQSIHEYGRWVHLGARSPTGAFRCQLLTAKLENGKTRWISDLVAA